MLQVLQGRIWNEMEEEERGVVRARATVAQFQLPELGQDQLGPTRLGQDEVPQASAVMLGQAQFVPPVKNKESCGIEANGLYFKQWDPSGISSFFLYIVG